MKTTSQYLSYKISCYTLGILFIFSGLAKGINPFGLSLQFTDYFTVLYLGFLTPFAELCAVGLPMVEATLGVMLILGLYRRISAWAALLFMGFFTLLTLWIALENPVTDCGCFGDLLVISNWATFYKNIAFMLPTVVVFLGRNQSPQQWKPKVVIVIALLFGTLPLVTLNYLPLVDSTPFKKGVNIWEAINDGVPPEVETVVIYRDIETGDSREFELSDTTWRNSNRWEYVDTKSVVVSQGREATITQLPMIDENGVDNAASVLQTKGDVLLIISPNPAKQKNKIGEIIKKIPTPHNTRIILLHPTTQIIEIPGIEVYKSDYKTLLTAIQNKKGGYLLLNNGTITQKKAL